MAGALVIMSSAIVVLGGLVALVRAMLKIRDTIMGNTRATHELTGKLNDLTTGIDGRFDQLADRVARLEGRRR